MVALPSASRLRRFLCVPALIAVCLLPGAVSAGSSHYWPAQQWGQKDERGDPNGAIRAFQYLLRARGYKIAADGVYGRATERAVRRFQAAHHLIASGEANTPTWEALILPLRQGSSGDAVRAAQIRLRAAGFALPVDGRYGAQMQAVVRRFQAQTDHTSDGLIGPYTWSELIARSEGGGGD